MFRVWIEWEKRSRKLKLDFVMASPEVFSGWFLDIPP